MTMPAITETAVNAIIQAFHTQSFVNPVYHGPTKMNKTARMLTTNPTTPQT